MTQHSATHSATGHPDDLVVFEDDEASTHSTCIQSDECWRVLVVDDDETVHLATKLALADLNVEGRSLQLLHAYSAEEAFELANQDGELAVALVDVVMEAPDAGLQLVRRIREGLGRRAIRLILRTGQPGYAPELETVRNYDINDYWTKTELTRTRLFVCLTTAVRSYRQFVDIEQQRDQLAELARALEASRAAEREAAERRLDSERQLREAHESMEACIEQRTRELSQAVSELETFNRMVAHDLRGPLHGLAGLSGMIQGRLDEGDYGQVRSWLGMMDTQTRRLADLVAGLLNLSQIAKGSLHRSFVSLDTVIDEARQSLALGADPNVNLAIEVRAMPAVQVDPVLMRQVFVNLLSNARKFTRTVPQPKVVIECESDDAGCTVRVRDNGIGFPREQLDRLFRPFSRLHGKGYEGSGIGLTIVQRIVEQHGGRVWAEGDTNHGAIFSFTLPS